MPASQTESRVEQLTRAIIEAESRGLFGETPPDVLSGFSGERLVGALQRFTRLLPRDGQTVYCEVGVFQGMTLLSTAHANPQIPCFGIDNFSQFDAEGRNHALVRERARRLGVTNARIVDADFEDALRRAEQWLDGRAIGVYFVDGPHDYRSQIVCLLQAKRLLAEGAVIVVDDSNYEHVRRANADFLASHDDFALLFEAYTPCHPANMDEAAREVAGAAGGTGRTSSSTTLIARCLGRFRRSDRPICTSSRTMSSVRSSPRRAGRAAVLRAARRCRRLGVRSRDGVPRASADRAIEETRSVRLAEHGQRGPSSFRLQGR